MGPRVATVGIVLVIGCYDPTIQELVPCGEGSVCPTGQSCVRGVCRREAVDTPDAALVPIDAAIVPIDAPEVDGPPADTDADGIPNMADNCPMKANANQHDEDGDGPGDVCDNCPHIANASQADNMDGADGVGDICDPNPMMGGDRIDRFYGFEVMSSSFTVNGSWAIAGDAMTYTTYSSGQLNVLGTRDTVVVEIAGTTTALNPAEMFLGVYAGNAAGKYHDCAFYDLPNDYHVGMSTYYDGADWNILTEEHLGNALSNGVAYTVRLSLNATANTLRCDTIDPRATRSFPSSADQAQPGTVGIDVYGARVAIRYLIVYAR
jgi:hypothetical protein